MRELHRKLRGRFRRKPAAHLPRLAVLALLSTMTMPWHLTAAGEGDPSAVETRVGNDARESAPEQSAALASPELQEQARLSYFTDLPLVTQNGQTVRFYSDVLKGKVVLVNFLFTHCPGVCPIHAAKLAELQKLLGPRMGDRIRFVSISIDPDRDTPAALREYADRFGAGNGWIFLTGSKQNVTTVAGKLGNTSPDVEAHLPLFLLGNIGSGDWIKMRPDASAETLADELLGLIARDQTGS